jgi:hypothetical protein
MPANRLTPVPLGQKFGRLTVIGRTESTPSGKTRWKCRCDCGKITQSYASNLRCGRTKSCGCLQKEAVSKHNAKRNYRHGNATRNNKSSLYECWINIKARCLNPKNASFKNYGGRGISIAGEWVDDFPAFKKYIDQNLGPKPKGDYSIDRIENHENYVVGNLRWAPRSIQNNNSRHSLIEKALTAVLLECRVKL